MAAVSNDDWADDLPIRRPVRLLRIEAHDLFDPIWQTGLAWRGEAYHLLAAELGVPEPRAHFKEMPGDLLEQAIPAIRRLRQRLGLDPVAEIT